MVQSTKRCLKKVLGRTSFHPVEDVVLLKNDGVPRVFWKLATVRELLTSEDGIVRAARVRVVDSDRGRASELRRPTQHLISLELQIEPGDEADTTSTDHEVLSFENDNLERRQPRRTTAVIGELQRRDGTK